MGLSVSTDDGATWEPRIPFLLGSDERLDALQADPWLVTSANHRSVWYSFIALRGDRSIGVAITRSDDGGLTWGPAFPEVDDSIFTAGDSFTGEFSVVLTSIPIDKPSIAVSSQGRFLYLTYVCPRRGDTCGPPANRRVTLERIDAATGDREAWTVLADDSRAQNPIVRVSPATRDVHVLFQSSMSAGVWRLQATRFDPRDPGAGLAGPFTIVNRIQPATPFGAQPGDEEPVTIANPFFYQYVISDDGFHHLVWEDGGQVFHGRSTVGIDTFPFRTLVGGSVATGQNAFQPTISAQGAQIGVAYYFQAATATAATTVVEGVVSEDRVDSWTLPTTVTRDDSGSPISFEPCPSFIRQLGGRWTIGEYIGSTSLALPPDTEAQPFYVLWTDSRQGCERSDAFFANHQHTMGAAFQ